MNLIHEPDAPDFREIDRFIIEINFTKLSSPTDIL